MGVAVREDREKFHAKAYTGSQLYSAIEAAVAESGGGPIEIDITVRCLKATHSFSADVENPQELLEILRLATGR